MAVNKVIKSDGTTLIDITGTTATVSDVAEGKVFYGADGTEQTGTAVMGGGSAISVVDTTDSHGGTIRTITAVDLSADTVTAATLLQGYTAHDRLGNAITGTASGGGASLQAKTNISPTTASQTITPDSGYDGLSSVQINAMPTGTAGTPTATKGTVSNHSVTVTPSVTNSTGYITGGTKTGTAVTVSASELVSGSETKTENGTYDVTNLETLVVNVPTGGSSPWTHILTQDVDVTTTSTSYATAATISCGSAIVTAEKIVWVHIRDKAGKRTGHFYGSDAFFINYNKKNGSSSAFAVPAVVCIRHSSLTYAGTSGQYGVYAYSIGSSGTLTIRSRYNASYSGTVDGTFQVDVYTLDLPDGLTLFN